jgi:hypothetical protein
MSELTVNMMMSLDGYTADPEQSAENPFALGGMELLPQLDGIAATRLLRADSRGRRPCSS